MIEGCEVPSTLWLDAPAHGAEAALLRGRNRGGTEESRYAHSGAPGSGSRRSAVCVIVVVVGGRD